ncbi:hypothetical protein ACGFYQ_34005 [Streptomyces sp. NPDC048258]|uniref:hypothetical protein n=1 Tax=Streptomyces sp. NPDC048258 TaxID=3365527 RepID=UPI00372214FB
MTALAVEAPAAAPWGGRLVVRAAGGLLLHIATEGAEAPAATMFTVPLECCQDREQAPGVRPWAGTVDEASVCPSCLRSLRGEPEPAPPRLVGTGTAEQLPEAGPARRLWAVPDPPSYAPAALPAEHGGRPITWSPWTLAPVITHYSSACDWCGDAGPCEMAGGRQGSPQSAADPLRRYAAYRCSHCQQMTAYEHRGGDLKPIAHHKSRAPKDSRR